MKRQSDRESPSRVKKYRARSPFNHRSYRDHSPNVRESRYNQRDARRNVAPNRYPSHRSPVRSPRYSPPPIEPARSRRNYRDAEDVYYTLLVRNFSSQLLKEDIQESLEYEFQRFGKVTVNVTRDYKGERVAYATFRDPEDAKKCKNAKGHLVMHDRRLAISVVNEDQQEERLSPKYRSPYNRDLDYSPRRRSPVVDRTPPRRRSPKQIYTRGRTPPKEKYQSRDRPYNDRFSPRPRVSGRDKRGSDDQSPRNSRYSSRERGSSTETPRLRSRSFSRERSPDYNGSQSRDRGRSKSSDSSVDKKADISVKDKDTSSTPNVSGGFDSNSFPTPGFVEKSIPPEDDPFATRTLFVGNLEADVSSYDLARIFEEYGDITDIDVKRAAGGQGAYAFVRYTNLNQAYKAKVNLNGKTILTGTNVRIGYGKVIVSSKIWVGGLGDWTTLSDLEREFDRFGAIRRIDFRRGDDSATISYETIDAAQAACNQMRGFLMPNAETRLRIDFISAEPGMSGKEGYSHWSRHDSKGYDNHGQNYGSSGDRYSANKYKNNSTRYRGRNVFSDDRKGDRRNRNSRSPGGRYEKDKPKKSSIHETAMTELQLKRFHAKSCYSLHDLCQVFDPPCWQGGFVLKKIAFPVLFFMLEGDMGIFNTTTADPNSPTGRQTMFHVTKRMRLTDDKVKEVSRRMKYCERKSCLIVAVPGVPENLNMSGTMSGPLPTQHKPLRGLVKYFKEKNAAAIISVPLIAPKPKDGDGANEKPKEKEVSGYIHAFPPGSFATEQLLKIGPSLQPSFFAEEFLVAVLVKGSTSALL